MTLPRTEQELQRIVKECRQMLQRYGVISGAVGAVPLPGVDIAVDLFNMKNCLDKINQNFSLSKEQIDGLGEGEKIVTQTIISVGTTNLVGKAITIELIKSLLKRMGLKIASKQLSRYVPFIGSAISAAIGYGSFTTICNKHIADCENTIKEVWKAQTLDQRQESA